MKKLLVVLAAMPLAACQTMSFTATEKHLNRFAGAEVVAAHCPAYGGYGSVAAMRADAQTNLARAKALGATEADVQMARQRLGGQFSSMVILVGPVEACNALINNLAWVGSTPAVSDPKPKKAAPAKGQ
jgi:hypothetical protein